jgi:hypothetical protein
VPTLNRAAEVAPTLTRLATSATPTVKLAVPTLSSLSNIAKLAQPLSTWVGLSSSDLFNIFDGWTHAIQFRDGISHVFNGDIYMNAGLILSTANKFASGAQRRQNLLDIINPAIVHTLGLAGAQRAARAAGTKPGRTRSKHPAAAPSRSTVKPTASVASPGTGAGSGSAPTAKPSGLGGLLSGLLGGLGGDGSAVGSGGAGSGSGNGSGPGSGNGSGASGTGGSGGGSSTPGLGLGGLLSYLLGK